MTFTNITKSLSSFSNPAKSSSSFTEETKSGFIGYILAKETNDPAFTMVGADEDFVLIFDDGATWYNLEKSS